MKKDTKIWKKQEKNGKNKKFKKFKSYIISDDIVAQSFDLKTKKKIIW